MSAGFARHGDRETEARIAQYELAYRMQTAVRLKDFPATVPHILVLDHLRLGHMYAGLNHCLTACRGMRR